MEFVAGLEPATSCMASRRSNQLNYTNIWWQWVDSNHRPKPYEDPALPLSYAAIESRGAVRTPLHRVRQRPWTTEFVSGGAWPPRAFTGAGDFYSRLATAVSARIISPHAPEGYPCIYYAPTGRTLEQLKGLEPSPTGWRPVMLPLHHSCIWSARQESHPPLPSADPDVPPGPAPNGEFFKPQ